jgi:hypothetical protein
VALLNRGAAHVVESQDQIGCALEGLGRCDILDPVLLPQSAAIAEGVDAAFGADSRAGEDHDMLGQGHGAHHAGSAGLCQWKAFACLHHCLFANAQSDLRMRATFGQGTATMARIGIIGSAGRMGQALGAAVVAAGHELSGGIDREGDVAALAQASDVLVDFRAGRAGIHARCGDCGGQADRGRHDRA